MTSFIKIRPYQYLFNGMRSVNQIWYASSSGQGSVFRSNSGSVRVKTDAHARVEILKCSNRPKNLFAHVSGHFEHFMSARAYRRACARTLYTSKTCRFFDWFGRPNKFSIIWNLSRSFWTYINGCAREKPQKSTLTRVGWNWWNPTYFKINITLKQTGKPPNFFLNLERGWVVDTISCVI